MNLAELTNQMEENNRSTFEIERHTRNGRGHLLEIKKSMYESVDIQMAMFKTMQKLLENLVGNSLKDLEAAREARKGKGGGDVIAKADFTGTDMAGGLGLALGGAALAIGAGIAALKAWATTVKAFTKLFTPLSLQTRVDKIVKGIADSWKLGVAAFKTAMRGKILGLSMRMTLMFDDFKKMFTIEPESKFGKVKGKILGLSMRMGLMFDDFKKMFTIGPESKFGKAIAGIKGVFGGLSARLVTFADNFKPLISLIGRIAGGVGKGAAGPIARLKGFFTTVKNGLFRFGTKFSGISKLLGKIFVPIAILMTAFDTVKGALDGYAEDGILGGLKGAIDGLITSLITIPLDLVKSAVTWLLLKMGLISEDTSEDMKNFSFTDTFKKITAKIFSALKGIFTWLGDQILFNPEGGWKSPLEMLKGLLMLPFNAIKAAFEWITSRLDFRKVLDDIGAAFGSIAQYAKDLMKKILRMVLPRKDATDDRWYSLKNMTSGALSKIAPSLYTFAGIDPGTHLDVPEKPTTGEAMNGAAADTADFKGNQAALSSGGTSTTKIDASTTSSVTIKTNTPPAGSPAAGSMSDLTGGYATAPGMMGAWSPGSF